MPFTKASKTVVKYDPIINATIEAIDVAGINSRIDAAEKKNIEQDITLGYITQRYQTSSTLMIEMFTDKKNIDQNNYETLLKKAIPRVNADKIFPDSTTGIQSIWNDNWYQTDAQPLFKNGSLQQDKIYYKGECIDIYDIATVGQPTSNKEGLSRWDSVNQCYWFLSTQGANGIGELVKISKEKYQEQLQVTARWYLPAAGSSTYWRGIDVDSTGTNIWIVLYGSSTTTSKLYGFPINIDGTIGKAGYTKVSGESLDLVNSPYASGIRTISNSGLDVGYYTDVTEYDTNYLLVLACNSTTTVTMLKIAKTALAYTAGSDITGFGAFTTNNSYYKSFIKSGNDIFIKCNEAQDQRRYIFRLDITTDVVSNAIIKLSDRLDLFRNDDSYFPAISISHDGHILEVINTTSFAEKWIVKRAWANYPYAEGSAINTYIPTFVAGQNRAFAADGDYFWYTANNTGSANVVRIYRRNRLTGVETYATVNAGSWTYVFDLCFGSISGTDYAFILGNTTVSLGRVVPKATLVAALGGNIDLGTVGTAFTGSVSTLDFVYNNNAAYGICTDGTYLYVINDTLDRIERWNMTSPATADSVSYITLFSSITTWGGIAYYNDNFYLSDYNSNAAQTHKRIYCISRTLRGASLNGKTLYLKHVYQGPHIFSSPGNIDFIGTDLYSNIISSSATEYRIGAIKILEDPDVMQLHSMLSPYNVLLSRYVSVHTEIYERYFSPEEYRYADDVPDQFSQWIGYAYQGGSVWVGGVTLLGLDEFLNDYSVTGMPRRDVTAIKAKHFIAGYNSGTTKFNLIPGAISAPTYIIIRSIECDRDIVSINAEYTFNSYITYIFLNMKAGTAYATGTLGGGSGTTGLGGFYQGTYSQRNSAIGYTLISDPDKIPYSTGNAGKVVMKTFSKDDISDYNYDTTRTYALMGNGNSGSDLVVWDWDSNNNATLRKIYPGHTSWANYCYALFIAPDGYIFMGSTSTSPSNFLCSFKPIWFYERAQWMYNAQTAAADFTSFACVGASNYGINTISKNSICFRLPSGQWRHILMVGGSELGASDLQRVQIYDIENNIYYDVFAWNAGATHYGCLDYFEGRLWFMGYMGLTFLKRSRIQETCYNIYRSGWVADHVGGNTSGSQTLEYNGKTGSERPIWIWQFSENNPDSNTTARCFRPIYSPKHNILSLATDTLQSDTTPTASVGVQYIHSYFNNNCMINTNTLTINNPKQIHYLKSESLPYEED